MENYRRVEWFELRLIPVGMRNSHHKFPGFTLMRLPRDWREVIAESVGLEPQNWPAIAERLDLLPEGMEVALTYGQQRPGYEIGRVRRITIDTRDCQKPVYRVNLIFNRRKGVQPPPVHYQFI